MHDVLIDRELKRRPAYLALSQGQRDGLDCMNFFFDLINECAGYTKKYYEEIGAGKLTVDQMITKYRKQKDDPQNSELLANNYPHCLLVIEGVHRLFRMYRKESKGPHLSVDYLDSLILRLHTGCEGEWYRNHFPVIFETNMSQYFNEEIYDDM